MTMLVAIILLSLPSLTIGDMPYCDIPKQELKELNGTIQCECNWKPWPGLYRLHLNILGQTKINCMHRLCAQRSCTKWYLSRGKNIRVVDTISIDTRDVYMQYIHRKGKTMILSGVLVLEKITPTSTRNTMSTPNPTSTTILMSSSTNGVHSSSTNGVHSSITSNNILLLIGLLGVAFWFAVWSGPVMSAKLWWGEQGQQARPSI